MSREKRTQGQVASVERAMAILDSFSREQPRLSLAQLSDRTGFYRSTLLRLTDSLIRFGYIQRDAGGVFSLGPAVWRLGLIYQGTVNLEKFVRPVLAELVQRTGESAALYVREGNKRLCLYRHHSSSAIRHHLDEGGELPLGKGAGSHIVRAYTETDDPAYAPIREQGYAIAMGEIDPETGGMAVPVFAAHGEFVGALGVSGFRSHFIGDNQKRFLDILIEHGKALSESLADLPPVSTTRAAVMRGTPVAAVKTARHRT